MKVSDEYTNKFGIYAYEISQAVDPDYVIMSTLYEDFRPEYFDNVNTSTRYRFGYEVDCFNLTNVQFDWDQAIRLSNDLFIRLDADFISKKTEQYANVSIPVYNIFDAGHGDALVTGMVDKLSGYADTEII